MVSPSNQPVFVSEHSLRQEMLRCCDSSGTVSSSSGVVGAHVYHFLAVCCGFGLCTLAGSKLSFCFSQVHCHQNYPHFVLLACPMHFCTIMTGNFDSVDFFL